MAQKNFFPRSNCPFSTQKREGTQKQCFARKAEKRLLPAQNFPFSQEKLVEALHKLRL